MEDRHLNCLFRYVKYQQRITFQLKCKSDLLYLICVESLLLEHGCTYVVHLFVSIFHEFCMSPYINHHVCVCIHWWLQTHHANKLNLKCITIYPICIALNLRKYFIFRKQKKRRKINLRKNILLRVFRVFRVFRRK